MSNQEEKNLQFWMEACEETSAQMKSFEEIKTQREYLLKKNFADELTSDDYIKINNMLITLDDIAKEYGRLNKSPRSVYVCLETDQKCNNFITELKKYLPADYKIKTSIYVSVNGKRDLAITLDL